MTPEERLYEQLASLGLEMPAAAAPKGVYRSAFRIGDLLYTAGHLPVQADGSLVTGRLGAGMDVGDGYAAVHAAGLAAVAPVAHGFFDPDNPSAGAVERIRACAEETARLLALDLTGRG